MARWTLRARPVLALAAFILASPGHAAEWAQEVVEQFVEPHTREHVEQVASEKSKPVMVIAMTTWCGACSLLRGSVNSGSKVRPLLGKFVVAYATEEGEANVWTEAGQNYVPQVYFFNSRGEQLQVFSESPQYKYYFSDEANLERAMLKALDLVASQPATAPTPSPAMAGESTHGSTSPAPAPDRNVPVFDPDHAFDESVAGHFLVNINAEEIRKKAVEANRPFMVMLTTSWCHACKDLIQSVNGGKETKDLLDHFVNLHAHGDRALSDWQPEGHDYVPQVLFFDVDGSLMDVKGPYAAYSNFYSSDKELANGMAAALDASKSVGEL